MYCRCPECETVFSVTKEQLQGRDGLVRCGHCTTVFRGDLNLIEEPGAQPETEKKPIAPTPEPQPEPELELEPEPELELEPEPELELEPEPEPKVSVEAPTSTIAATEPVAEIQIPEPATFKPVKINTSKAPRHIRPEQQQLSKDEVKDILHGLVGRKPGERTRPLFWGLGILLLLALLTGQTLYYYRDTLGWHPTFGPYIQLACEELGCKIAPRRDIAQIELTGTTVAPHPKYKKILRVKASLINRAKYSQPFPIMEVKLTNRRGETTSRRLFTADQYLKDKAQLTDGMPRNIAMRAILDVNNPDSKTEGYEIRLVAQ